MGALEDAQEEVKPDMTPMIDVVFLMIIFFICIDFKVLESKLPAYLPKDKGSQTTVVEPQEQLSVKIHVDNAGTPDYSKGGGGPGILNPNTKRPYRFALQGHAVKWEVGPRQLNTLEAVKAELSRIAKDPSSQVPDKETGGKKLMGCVIEAYPGTYYDDVAKTADACHDAGFKEINFGGGLGEKKK
jgi:Biopolymer transport protein ExbD/TolR